MGRGICALAALALLSACAGKPNYDAGRVTAAQTAAALPAPEVGDVMAASDAYRIGPFDKLAVTIYGTQDLNRTGQVDSDGNFDMPLVGSVKAVGDTATEFGSKLTRLYGLKYLQNPQVSVSVVESNSRAVTVDGGVSRPGKIQLGTRTTLLEAIASAGGTTEFARPDEILVFRNAQGKRMVARFDLTAIRGGRAEDPQVYGNDVIVVGDNSSRRNMRDILQSAPLLGVFFTLLR